MVDLLLAARRQTRHKSDLVLRSRTSCRMFTAFVSDGDCCQENTSIRAAFVVSEASLYAHVGCRGNKVVLRAWAPGGSNCRLPRVSSANCLVSLYLVATRLRCESGWLLLRRWGCAMLSMRDAGLRKPWNLSSLSARYGHAPASSSTRCQHSKQCYRCSLSLPLSSWRLCGVRGCQAACEMQTHHRRSGLAAQAVTIEGRC
jgi:hypothetical protein